MNGPRIVIAAVVLGLVAGMFGLAGVLAYMGA